jgi:hypothetical protein
MSSPARRRLAAGVAAALAAALLALASPAGAADIYKYWAYFSVQDGEFVSQGEGPGGTVPDDGAIEAYRYAAPADFESPNLPRADLSELTFDAVCGESAAESGQKRVAVLVDYGVEADAPDGETPGEPESGCAVVGEDASGLQVLSAVATDVRTEKQSFGPALCAVNGYPATGCVSTLAETASPPDGEPVEFRVAGEETTEAAATTEGDDDFDTVMLVGVGAVAVILVAGGVLLQRRRGRTA